MVLLKLSALATAAGAFERVSPKEGLILTEFFDFGY